MLKKAKSLSAFESPVSEIFSDNFLFEIPNYQRPYAWKVEQALELISDIQDYIADENGNIEDLNPYFLGSIVLIKNDKPEAKIIDGQQRLTTLTIIFSVLRTLIHDEGIKVEITKYLGQESNKLLNKPAKYKLQLRALDRDFFEKYIQENNQLEPLFALQTELSDSQHNIQRNAKYIYNELKPKSQQHLIRITQFILQGCYLVVVITPDLNSAYRIFSVMNDRGVAQEWALL